MSSLLRSSKFIRYFAGAARNLVVSTRYNTEAGQLRNYQVPQIPNLRTLATQAANTASQFTSNLEKSLQQIDYDVRRTGRISRKELEDVLEEIKQSKSATSSQSLLVIRCCGSLVPEELPEIRTQLVQEIWATLEKIRVPMDISHYNALLRVYLENEHNFSPAEFLQDLEKKGVEPNRVTYQRLITRYCQQGDIEGATRILEHMREKSLPVNENVFNALIMGHSQSEDMESATGILAVMKQAGLDPSADTYTTLLVGYAKLGDMAKIREILAECDRNDIYLLDKDHLDLVFALATNGQAEHVDEILVRTRKSAGFNQDAVSLILRLVNHGQERVALKVLKQMPRPQRDENDGGAYNQGNFFVRQLIKAKRPPESVLSICKELESEGLNNKALAIATETSLAQGNVEMAVTLLTALQETGVPIRQHYFWPLICAAGKAKNDDGIARVISEMNEKFHLTPSGETVREYVVPNLTVSGQDYIVGFLKRAGVSSGVAACALVHDYLMNGAIMEAANVASKYRAFYSPILLRRPLSSAYLKTSSTEHYLNLIHLICEGMERKQFPGDDADGSVIDKRDVVGYFLQDLITSARGRSLNLEAIFEGLLQRGLGMTNEAAEQIQGKLSGEQLTNEISELLTKLTGLELPATQAIRNKIPLAAFDNDEITLKQRILKVEEAGHPSTMIKRNLVGVHCKNQEVDKALEVLKSMGNDAGPGAYAYVIEGLTTAGKLDDALDLFQDFRKIYPDSSLDPLKVIRLVDALFKQNRVEDGLRLLEENKVDRKFDDVPFVLKSAAFQALNTLAENGDVANLEKTFKMLVEKNYVEVTNVILGPLIKVHVLKNDISTALNKLEEFVEKYKMTPWKNELTKKLVDAEDAGSLQRITDISSKVHGEVNSLYDLVFAFVECGRIRQARKILETPGMRSRQQRLNVVCERYQQEGSVSALEGLVEATKDMTHIDRSDIFHQLLTTHIKNDDADNALGVWTLMQEEDVQPSDPFLIKLAKFLQSKGKEVPFAIPTEKKAAKIIPQEQHVDKKYATSSSALIGFKNAIKSQDWVKALEIKKNLVGRTSISNNDLSLILEGLCQTNQLDKARDLAFDILKSGGKILPKHFKFFTNKLASAGKIDDLKEIGNIIDNELKKVVSYDNKLCGAYLSAGRASEYLDFLLAEVKSATQNEVARLEEKFPRGAMGGIFENNPELLPKFEQIADEYLKVGSRSPGNALWIGQFLSPDLKERADKSWEKYQLAQEPRLMVQRIITRARTSSDLKLIDRLLARTKESQISEPAKGVIHSCAIDILVNKDELDEALSRLKLVLADVSLENINASCLHRLKKALEAKGKTFPYTIPLKGNVPAFKHIPTLIEKSMHVSSESSESADFYTSLIGFDGSCLKKPKENNWKKFLKDDTGILSKVPFNPRCILRIVSIDESIKQKEKRESSSSSDDETEQRESRK